MAHVVIKAQLLLVNVNSLHEILHQIVILVFQYGIASVKTNIFLLLNMKIRILIVQHMTYTYT